MVKIKKQRDVTIHDYDSVHSTDYSFCFFLKWYLILCNYNLNVCVILIERHQVDHSVDVAAII